MDPPLAREWTGAHVCHLFVRARCAFNGRAFLVVGGVPGSVSTAILVPAGLEAPPLPAGPLKVMHWFNRYLTDDEKPQFREWLRVKVGAGGPSLREIVAAHPSWGTWRTYNRRRAAICERIAADLKKRGVPWFDLDREGHVIGELMAA